MGINYQWKNYDILVVPEFHSFAAMENPQLTFYGYRYLSTDDVTRTLIHEICHQWFGNIVSYKNFEHFWINEGLTTFLTSNIIGMLYGEAEQGLWEAFAWDELVKSIKGLENAKKPFRALVNDLTGKSLLTSIANLITNFTFYVGIHPADTVSNIPYQKGSVFMWFLANQFGKKIIFNRFLKLFLMRYVYGSVDSMQFKSFFEKTIGGQGQVDWEHWLYGQGVPNYRPSFDNTTAQPCWRLAKRWQNWKPGRPAPTTESFKKLKILQKKVYLSTILMGEKGSLGNSNATLYKMEEVHKFHEEIYDVTSLWIQIIVKFHWAAGVDKVMDFVRIVSPIQPTLVDPVLNLMLSWDEMKEEFQDMKNVMRKTRENNKMRE